VVPGCPRSETPSAFSLSFRGYKVALPILLYLQHLRQLLERVKAGDLSVDFRALRMACARSNICEVRATPEELAELARAGTEQRQTDVVEICVRLISHGFVNLEAHIACAQADTVLNRPDQAKSHMDIMTALFQSVLTADDGTTEDTAYEVISVGEVYLV
jgi:hypothetical protein